MGRTTPITLDEEGNREMNVVRCKLHVYREIEIDMCLRKNNITLDIEEGIDKEERVEDKNNKWEWD